MWVDEMQEIQRRHYGFVKLTIEDFKLLGIGRKVKPLKSSELCEACRLYPVSYKNMLLSLKNASSDKRRANLCKECERNNSGNRKIPTEWAIKC
ncbi:hypothetical protein J2T13_000827 [Paenibacillus sp. DS2015]